MLTKIMKWICSAALLLAALWRSSASSQVMLQFVVCMGAILVALQAVRRSKYFWVAGFTAIAVLFNPLVPVTLPRKLFLALDWVCLSAFLASLAVLKTRPILSIASITNRTPGSESL